MSEEIDMLRKYLEDAAKAGSLLQQEYIASKCVGCVSRRCWEVAFYVTSI